jgi:hypothetical protein
MKRPRDVIQPRGVYFFKRKAESMPFTVTARDTEQAIERNQGIRRADARPLPYQRPAASVIRHMRSPIVVAIGALLLSDSRQLGPDSKTIPRRFAEQYARARRASSSLCPSYFHGAAARRLSAQCTHTCTRPLKPSRSGPHRWLSVLQSRSGFPRPGQRPRPRTHPRVKILAWPLPSPSA